MGEQIKCPNCGLRRNSTLGNIIMCNHCGFVLALPPEEKQ
jgi:predicted RNA-binding Zn-ribbon protein involved in translation (DUF1610 family)